MVALYKLVLIGVGGVGKSCLTLQFIAQKFVEDYDPTLEDSYRKQCDVDGEDCLLDIFDTAGQQEFSAVRDQYMMGGDGFMCVFSVVDTQSFIEVQGLHEHTLRIKDCQKIPFIIIGNKADLVDLRKVTTKETEDLANQLGVKWLETSAKDETNVHESFFELVREIKKFHESEPVKPGNDEPGEKAKPSGGGRRMCMLL